MESSQLFQVFQSYAEQLPTFLALIAGIVFAVWRWKQHPKVAMVVVIALACLLVHQLIFTIIFVYAPSWLIRSFSGSENFRTVIDRVFFALGLLSNFSAAIGFGVLLAAIFMKRKPLPVAET